MTGSRIAPNIPLMRPCGTKQLIGGQPVYCWECQWKEEEDRPKDCPNMVDVKPKKYY